ncbi:MAG: VOC family protein [Firmicutes bacterium]|uniref:VOC family protein n=1 Tax=Candidatus Gallilactobacillus intestinavium TaxID=2840838 RepID=A0A9D9E7J3_9LACO|nr:VOC family protein [Candidatus Gallilactobacillus intestinavium]
MDYYHEVFGAEIIKRQPISQKMADSLELVDIDLENSTMYGCFKIFETLIVCSDDLIGRPQHATNISIMLRFDKNNSDDSVAAQSFFDKVSNSGRVQVTEPYCENTIYGGKYGSFTDEFGVNWIVSCSDSFDVKEEE